MSVPVTRARPIRWSECLEMLVSRLAALLLINSRDGRSERDDLQVDDALLRYEDTLHQIVVRLIA